MSRIFMDGFESGKPAIGTYTGSYAYSGGMWQVINVSTNANIQVGVTNTSRNAFSVYSFRVSKQLNAAGTFAAEGTCPLPTTYTELYGRCYVRYTWTSGTTSQAFTALQSGSTIRMRLAIDQNYAIVGIANGSTVFTTANNVAPANTWVCVEWHWKANATTGELTVKVNDTIAGTYVGNTGTVSCDTIAVGGPSTSTTTLFCNLYVDDLVLNDTTGSINNSWCRQGTIVALVPKGAGNYTQWTPNTGANYAAVDEIPNDADTTYVVSNTVGQIDTYNMQELVADKSVPSTAIVNAVQWQATARYTDASGIIAPMLRSGTTDAEASNVAVGSAYTDQIKFVTYDVSPFTSSQWTVSEVDGLESGAKFKG